MALPRGTSRPLRGVLRPVLAGPRNKLCSSLPNAVFSDATLAGSETGRRGRASSTERSRGKSGRRAPSSLEQQAPDRSAHALPPIPRHHSRATFDAPYDKGTYSKRRVRPQKMLLRPSACSLLVVSASVLRGLARSRPLLAQTCGKGRGNVTWPRRLGRLLGLRWASLRGVRATQRAEPAQRCPQRARRRCLTSPSLEGKDGTQRRPYPRRRPGTRDIGGLSPPVSPVVNWQSKRTEKQQRKPTGPGHGSAARSSSADPAKALPPSRRSDPRRKSAAGRRPFLAEAARGLRHGCRSRSRHFRRAADISGRISAFAPFRR